MLDNSISILHICRCICPWKRNRRNTRWRYNDHNDDDESKWCLWDRYLFSIDDEHINESIHLSIYLSLYRFIYLSVHRSIDLCIFRSIYIYIYIYRCRSSSKCIFDSTVSNAVRSSFSFVMVSRFSFIFLTKIKCFWWSKRCAWWNCHVYSHPSGNLRGNVLPIPTWQSFGLCEKFLILTIWCI